MIRKALLPRPRNEEAARAGRKQILKLVENDLINRVSYEQYRDKVRDVYGGPQGAFLATASLLSLHIQLGDRLLRERRFDLRGVQEHSGRGQRSRPDRQASAQVCRSRRPDHLLRSLARNASPSPQSTEERPPEPCGCGSCRGCRLPTKASTASLAATCSNTCPIRGPAWPNVPRAASRRTDAAADHRGQLLGRLDQPAVVLPHLQPSRTPTHLRRAWA